nr:HNH endonuclease domain-containing protein [Leeuwenhoekiella aestuarii]
MDHVIPFSIWKNNDLWNLLPAAARINAKKRDKIPAPKLIERQRGAILEYWEILHKHQQQRFKKEIKVALLGNHAFDTWKGEGVTQLQNSCNYLIETRGFEAWDVR